ncbi:hypothetical protein HY405_00160 [Candidatus Microgenomates bacterium]|nr:hypothetical protein [Candidatus Microgenomates bacterium]
MIVLIIRMGIIEIYHRLSGRTHRQPEDDIRVARERVRHTESVIAEKASARAWNALAQAAEQSYLDEDHIMRVLSAQKYLLSLHDQHSGESETLKKASDLSSTEGMQAGLVWFTHQETLKRDQLYELVQHYSWNPQDYKKEIELRALQRSVNASKSVVAFLENKLTSHV